MSNTKGTSAIVPPSGGGAQSGMGEKFSPDLFTGTGNFSVPVAVPAECNGFQPELTLGYSTGNGNGSFGMGWALGIPGVTRKTNRGIPVYNDNEDIFLLSGAEDLVPVKQERETIQSGTESIIWLRTYYRPRTEGLFAKIIHHKKTGSMLILNGDLMSRVKQYSYLFDKYEKKYPTGKISELKDLKKSLLQVGFIEKNGGFEPSSDLLEKVQSVIDGNKNTFDSKGS